QLRVTSATHRFDFTAPDTRFRQPQRLVIFRSPPKAASSLSEKAMDEHDTVLGESCDWFDMAPGVMDAGRHECRTRDGIVLKEKNFGWGSSSWGLVAAHLSRRPISVEEVTLPAELLAPKFWGLD